MSSLLHSLALRIILALQKEVKALTDKKLWNKCQGCPLADRCFIKYNVDSLNDSAVGNEIIKRLEWIVRTIVYKRELHITMRDLRSMIAWMLTRDYSCADMPHLIESLDKAKREYDETPEDATEEEKNNRAGTSLVPLSALRRPCR